MFCPLEDSCDYVITNSTNHLFHICIGLYLAEDVLHSYVIWTI
jgi:hypothetical protein